MIAPIMVRINDLAYGATKERIGELVEIIDVKPNGLATKVKDGNRKRFWIPTRWLSEDE